MLTVETLFAIVSSEEANSYLSLDVDVNDSMIGSVVIKAGNTSIERKICHIICRIRFRKI